MFKKQRSRFSLRLESSPRERTLSWTLLLLAAAFMFFVGLHNVDNAWNMRTFNHYLETINDTNRFGENSLYYHDVSDSTAYMMGMAQMLMGFWLGIFFSMKLSSSLRSQL